MEVLVAGGSRGDGHRLQQVGERVRCKAIEHPAARLWRRLDRHTSPLLVSAHQHRIVTVVRAIKRRQRLPAFRREPLNVSVPNVAKHFRVPMFMTSKRRHARRTLRRLR